jgi:homoserine kinase
VKTARAFAPATIGNVGVGFDVLGLALAGIGETAIVEKIDSPTVVVEPVPGFPDLPLDPKQNTASAGLVELIRDKELKFGFRVRLQKQIPIGSGLGGSAASAVAAIVAANGLLKKKLTNDELLHYALTGEAVATQSRHADNVAPCLFGGLVFVRNHPKLRFVPVKTPSHLRAVVLLPKLSINTKYAREILKPTVPLMTMVEQTANLTGFLLGCIYNKIDLIKESLRDVVVEPQRAILIPSFSELQTAAIRAGALGCSISGSGPTLFALTEVKFAAKVQRAMVECAKTRGLAITGSWISPISRKGAHRLGAKK